MRILHLSKLSDLSEIVHLDYRIEVYNDKPLELLIEFRDRYEMDSHFAIFQEL